MQIMTARTEMWRTGLDIKKIDNYNFIMMLLVTHANLFSRSVHVLLCAGFKAHQTVFVVNREDQPFHFLVQKSSCHSEGYQDSLVLEPMEGTVPPKNKYVISFI